MKEFPHSDLVIMALLDSLSFSGLVVSASGVTPTMTVILLHSSTPCVVWGSMYVFPERKYSNTHQIGVSLITAAMLVSISRAIYYFISGENINVAESTILYVMSAAIQGFSTLYKEKSIISFGKPMDIHYLTSWLLLYQFGITLLLSPGIYILQGKCLLP